MSETLQVIYLPKKDFTRKKAVETIIFSDQINQTSIAKAVEILTKINAKDPNEEIDFRINSEGGLVFQAIELAEYFRNLSNPIHTIAESRCMSGATLLTAAGDKRSAWENCMFLIHQIQLNFAFNGPLSKLRELTDYYSYLNNRFLSTLSELTGQPFRKVLEDTLTDRIMTAQEAKNYGIIDEIIPRTKLGVKKINLS